MPRAADEAATEGVLLWALEQGHALLSLAAHKRARAAAAASAGRAAVGDPGEGAGGALQGLGMGGLQLGPGA